MTQPRLLGGRYELEGVVGRGGMAEVYRARDIRLDRIVAVKTLRADLARDQTFQARFRREAQSAASLNNPAIVAVYDTGEDMSTGVPIPYIVMEYVDGRTVRDLLIEGHRLLPERSLEIIGGVLRALEYSHQAGIIHRDIKPGNVMVTRNGDIKVMDFGIARAMNDAQATMTQTAQVIGTAQYLSPEQARGERVDARSDLYSAGCLLYELMTGRPPFTGDSPVAIAYQHVRENPIPPSQVDRDVPPWADAIVLKAMAKAPSDRYQTAAEMQADIQRAASGMQVAAMPPPPTRADYYGGGYGPPPTRMDQTAMMGGQTAMVPPYQGEYQEYAYQDEQGGGGGGSRARRWLPWIIGLLVVLGGVGAAAYMLLANNGSGLFVPSVVGETQALATHQLKAEGLGVAIKQQSSGSVTKGTVISANPSPGTSISKGQTVTLDVSSGPAKVTVPPGLAGESYQKAEAALQKVGLLFTTKPDNNSTLPAGTVVNANPPSGTMVFQNQTVTLTISGGGVTVPPVTNSSLASAEAALQQVHLTYTTKYEAEPGAAGGIPAGVVWYQSPSSGKVVAPGTSVTLYVEPRQTTPSPTPSASPSASQSPTPNPSSSSPGGGHGGH
jgi:beta-lactam-binding protein with PASTA domain/tRNA A-37 threonylcarbamoyl transferase component Bud32